MGLVVNTGRAVAVVAHELGINEATLGRWVNLRKSRQVGGDTPLSKSERVELAKLRQEVAELRLDQASFKRASLFFLQEASDTNELRSS